MDFNSRQSPKPALSVDRDGRWFADGHEITHPGTYRLFIHSPAGVTGGYCMRSGADGHTVTVEDTPWAVCNLRLMRNPASKESIGLWLQDGRRYTLDPDRPEISTRDTARSHGIPTRSRRARLTRAAWQQLLVEVDDATLCCHIRMNNRCYFIG